MTNKSNRKWPAPSKAENFQPAKLAALTVKWDSRPFKQTRKLALTKISQSLSITCLKTGISSLLDSPAIPGFALINEHPLAQIDNARGLAQRGRSYLKQLEGQVLAGLFITLASEYELLRTGPRWLAHEANATLRAVGPEALIEAILLIENWIHSNNAIYLPRLSLEPSREETIQSMNGRIINWFRLLHDAIIQPDKTIYDPNKKGEKIVFESVQKITTKNREAAKILTLERKNLAASKKILKEQSPKLKGASSKLKNYLLSLSTGSLLVSADIELVNLLKMKIRDLEISPEQTLILSALSAEFPNLRNEARITDPFADEEEDDLSSAKLVSMLDKPKSRDSEQETYPPESSNFPEQDKAESTNCDAEQAQIESVDSNRGEQTESVEEPEPSYKNMTPIQAILARKAWLRKTGRTEKLPFKTNEEEQSKFSLPAGLILGSAPKYEPSAEKMKLGIDKNSEF